MYPQKNFFPFGEIFSNFQVFILKDSMKNCVHCESEKIVKSGKSKDGKTQRYICRSCGRRFTEKTNPNLRTIINGKKYCNKCKNFKPLSDFSFLKGKPKSHCKKCLSDESNARYRNHGISESEFRSLLTAQENKCSICDKSFKSNRHTYIDHNHTNGKIRGLLCPKCNGILGLCNDDIKILQRAINFIVEHN